MNPETPEDRVPFPEWNPGWPRCEYRITEVQIPAGQFLIRPLIVEAVPGSKVEYYDPMTAGRLESKGKKREGEGWPPDLALANLNVRDDSAVERFCTQYGLLGLREVPKWRTSLNLPASPFDQKGESVWLDRPRPDPRPAGWNRVHLFSEPVDLIQEAAGEFQKACILLERMSEAKGDERQEIAVDLELEVMRHLDGCHPMARWNGHDFVLGYRFTSLLDACYVRLMRNMVESGRKLQKCADPKCKRFFLASKKQSYCSNLCKNRHAIERFRDNKEPHEEEGD